MRAINSGCPTAATAWSDADVGGAGGETEGGEAGRDRARGHQHDLVPSVARGGHLGAQLGERDVVELARIRRDRRRPDLHDRGEPVLAVRGIR